MFIGGGPFPCSDVLVDARMPTRWQASGGGPPPQLPQGSGQPPPLDILSQFGQTEWVFDPARRKGTTAWRTHGHVGQPSGTPRHQSLGHIRSVRSGRLPESPAEWTGKRVRVVQERWSDVQHPVGSTRRYLRAVIVVMRPSPAYLASLVERLRDKQVTYDEFGQTSSMTLPAGYPYQRASERRCRERRGGVGQGPPSPAHLAGTSSRQAHHLPARCHLRHRHRCGRYGAPRPVCCRHTLPGHLQYR